MTKVVPIRRHFSFEEHLQFFILEKKVQVISQRTEKDYWYMVSFFFRKYPDALISQKKLKNCVFQFFSQEVARLLGYRWPAEESRSGFQPLYNESPEDSSRMNNKRQDAFSRMNNKRQDASSTLKTLPLSIPLSFPTRLASGEIPGVRS